MTLGGTASGAFADKNVGTGNSITGTDSDNYNLVQQAGVTANITKKALTASVAAPNKTYDGNTTAAPTLSITAGLVGTETVTATGAATFNSKDIATASLVTVNSAALVALGNDVVIVGGGSGLFDDANVGTGNAVAVSGLTLSGVDSGNYNVLQPTGLRADITAAPSTPVPEPTPVTASPPSQESRRSPEPMRNVTSQLTANLTSSSGNNQSGMPGQSSFTKNTQESGQDSGDKPSSPNPRKELVVNTTMKIGDNGPTVKIVDGGVKFPGNNQPNEKDSDEI